MFGEANILYLHSTKFLAFLVFLFTYVVQQVDNKNVIHRDILDKEKLLGVSKLFSLFFSVIVSHFFCAIVSDFVFLLSQFASFF